MSAVPAAKSRPAGSGTVVKYSPLDPSLNWAVKTSWLPESGRSSDIETALTVFPSRMSPTLITSTSTPWDAANRPDVAFEGLPMKTMLGPSIATASKFANVSPPTRPGTSV